MKMNRDLGDMVVDDMIDLVLDDMIDVVLDDMLEDVQLVAPKPSSK